MITIQITIQVSADVARILRKQETSTSESKKLSNMAEKLNILLKPLHRDTEDPLLVSYFIVEVPASTTAENIISHLQQSTAVEAVYLKPPDEAP